jgi:hypothetical protein
VGLPPSSVEFSSHHHFYKLSCSWLLDVCHRSWLLQLACCDGFPLAPLQCSGCPALFATCLFCYSLLFSFFFFLLSLGGGRSVQGAMLIWPRVVCGNIACTLWSESSRAVWALPSGGSAGALLVSPFKVRCYAQAGGVEGSKVCLFSVVFPVRCISSVSPRFYFRKHAFCFLPLAAILESSKTYFWWMVETKLRSLLHAKHVLYHHWAICPNWQKFSKAFL